MYSVYVIVATAECRDTPHTSHQLTLGQLIRRSQLLLWNVQTKTRSTTGHRPVLCLRLMTVQNRKCSSSGLQKLSRHLQSLHLLSEDTNTFPLAASLPPLPASKPPAASSPLLGVLPAAAGGHHGNVKRDDTHWHDWQLQNRVTVYILLRPPSSRRRDLIMSSTDVKHLPHMITMYYVLGCVSTILQLKA